MDGRGSTTQRPCTSGRRLTTEDLYPSLHVQKVIGVVPCCHQLVPAMK
jgi:hypothetical protein